MKRIINILIISIAAVLSVSCMEKEVVTLPMNEAIVLDLSSGLTKAGEGDQAEQYVSYIDVFIFKAEQTKFDSQLVHYGRYTVNNSPSVTLDAKRSSFAEGQGYYVYLLANTNIPQDDFKSETFKTLRDLIDKKQKDENVYLSGLSSSHAPQYFLMDAAATADGSELIVINNGVKMDNTVIDANLRRAAAKVVINITATDNIMFKSFPDAPLAQGVYYVRNLPYDTYLLAEAKSADQIDAALRTPNKGTSKYFSWSPDTDSKNVSLTTYVYPHHWTNESLLEDETCVVMNLPMVHTINGESTDYHNSWYKIHMTNGTKFERNRYYEVNISLGRPGALSESEPVSIHDVHYDVEDWTEVTVNVDGKIRPQYLHLNVDHVDMYNVNTDVSSLIFASSSPIPADGIELLEAYYMNSVDAKVNVSSAYPQAYRQIKATAEGGVLNGQISIMSPFVAEGSVSEDSHSNTIRYMRFRVRNTTGQTAEFTVAQYPTIYITNELGGYSYRSDFGGTHYGYTGNPNYSGVNWSTDNGGSWTYSQQSSVTNHFFGSKYVRSGPDSSGNYDIDCVYRSGNSDQRVSDNTFNNPRMYHVHVTATSSEYILAKPRLDADGFTESSPENTKLVSPSFMIASQLGGTNIPGSTGGGFGSSGTRELPGGVKQAKMHCEQYVEVGADGKVYDDWRLPTAAEIDIIIQHQKSSDAMATVLSGSRYYCAYNLDSGQPEHTKSSEGGNSGSCHVRCIRDAY